MNYTTQTFKVRVRSSLAIFATACLMTGCQSVSTVNLYPDAAAAPDQQVTLVAPWCIDVRRVDETPVTKRLGVDELRVVLSSGPHTVEARYAVMYPTGRDDHEKVYSDYVRLSFAGQAGKTYVIGSQEPRTLEDTRRYAAHVKLWIEESPETGHARSDSGTTVAASAARTNAPGAMAGAAPMAQEGRGLDQLKARWNETDAQERQAFLDWVRQHP